MQNPTCLPVGTGTYGTHLGPHRGEEDGVDAAQLHIDLEAEVGEGLGRRLVHVLHLYALRGHAEEGVAHSLHLRVHGRLAGQDNHHQLDGGELLLQIFEHRLHLVGQRVYVVDTVVRTGVPDPHLSSRLDPDSIPKLFLGIGTVMFIIAAKYEYDGIEVITAKNKLQT